MWNCLALTDCGQVRVIAAVTALLSPRVISFSVWVVSATLNWGCSISAKVTWSCCSRSSCCSCGCCCCCHCSTISMIKSRAIRVRYTIIAHSVKILSQLIGKLFITFTSIYTAAVWIVLTIDSPRLIVITDLICNFIWVAWATGWVNRCAWSTLMPLLTQSIKFIDWETVS